MAKIVMVGPTGVGKTSLLAAMYPQLRESIHLVPQQKEEESLGHLRDQLGKLGEGGIKVTDKVITGTSNAQEFEFDVIHEEQKDMPLKIVDLPGAFYQLGDGHQAIEQLQDTDVSLWCVDAVALMEKGGGFHEQINSPKAIAKCYTSSQLNQDHSICIVLMRSEKYEQDNEIQNLFDKFRRVYKTFISQVRESSSCISKIYYCSVQTTGNLRFNHNDGNDTYNPEFIRHQGREYAPSGCEAPVLCAIKRCLEAGTGKALADIQKIVDEYFPFTRWLPFLPGHAEYKSRLATAIRLNEMLERKINPEIEKLLSADDADRRFFEWQ